LRPSRTPLPQQSHTTHAASEDVRTAIADGMSNAVIAAGSDCHQHRQQPHLQRLRQASVVTQAEAIVTDNGIDPTERGHVQRLE